MSDDHNAWTMRETAHYNGGSEWFGYKYQCIQQPRLSRKDRYTRKDRAVTSKWLVDGEECASFEEALDRLSVAPVMSAGELDTIAAFSGVVMAKRDFPDFDAVRGHLMTLSEKGLVWWENGAVRLLRDALLSAVGSAESNASGNPAWDVIGPRCAVARTAMIAASKGGK